ncbi:YceI family protein [Pinirhizobacter sp.]|jgi:polyisoprenoid-binding protein YceI|uniref:YceI family protein n=1 Tax=Pinirhizobacter sp. TaxID=2950432 RepID=UPI002F3F5A6D
MKYLAGPFAALLLSGVASAAAIHGPLHIDEAHSRAEFGVRLLWVTKVTGVFERIRGTIDIDPDDNRAVVQASIDVESLQMDSSRFRKWVLAPEFFDYTRYPSIGFVSTRIPLDALGNGDRLDGQLTMRGVTQPVHFTILRSDCTATHLSGCTLQALGAIDRTDFDMRGRRGALADRVELGLSITIGP